VSQTGAEPPDIDHPAELKAFWDAIQQLGRERKLLAYHDRSDGGLLATAVEMAFAGHTGVDLELPASAGAPFAPLVSEELGAVIQVKRTDLESVEATLRAHGLGDLTTRIGAPSATSALRVKQGGETIYEENLFTLRGIWSDVTRRIAALRDN